MTICCEEVVSKINYRGVINNAVCFCGAKLGGLEYDEVIAGLQKADEMTLGYFRYGVAKKLSEDLREMEPQLKRAYLMGEHDYLETNRHNPIHIVLQVDRKTSSLRSLLNETEREMLTAYRQMMGHTVDEQADFVFLEAIDEAALKTEYSYPCSIYAPPLPIE